MKIVFINRYFYPDHSATSQMLSDLAFALARRGHSVHVIASNQRYDVPEAWLAALEIIDGVTIRRVWMSRFGRDKLAGRAVDYLSFFVSCAWTLITLLRAGDVVVAKTDPPLLSLLTWPIARLRRARHVNWLQDIFPEVAGAAGLVRGRISRAAMLAIRTLRNLSLRHSDMTVVIGRRMAEHVLKQGVRQQRLRIIENWADGKIIGPINRDESGLRKAWGLTGAFVAGYSGNFGRAHERQTFLQAIKILEAVESASGETFTGRPVRWLFIGGGVEARLLRDDVQKQGLKSVQFQPYQPRRNLAESLGVPDVHLVSLRPAFEGFIVPSKVYGIAAAGRPTIFVGDPDGEVARHLLGSETGFVIAPGEGVALARLLRASACDTERLEEMGRRARAVFDIRHDVVPAADAWEDVIADVVAETALTRPVRRPSPTL